MDRTPSTTTDPHVNSFWKNELWNKFLGFVRTNDVRGMHSLEWFSKDQYLEAFDIARQAGFEEATHLLWKRIGAILRSDLAAAINKNDEQAVAALIADPRTAEFYINYDACLQDAVLEGRMWAVQQLIPVCNDNDYRDALFNALGRGDLDMVRVFAPLCDYKAELAQFCVEHAHPIHQEHRDRAQAIIAQLEREGIEQGMTDIVDGAAHQSAPAKRM